MKQQKFIIHYHLDGLYEARISADSLEEALQKAKGMNATQLNAATGQILDETVRITAVFE